MQAHDNTYLLCDMIDCTAAHSGAARHDKTAAACRCRLQACNVRSMTEPLVKVVDGQHALVNLDDQLNDSHGV